MGLKKKASINTQEFTINAHSDLNQVQQNQQIEASILSDDVSQRRSAAKQMRYEPTNLNQLVKHLYHEESSLVVQAIFDSLLYMSQTLNLAEETVNAVVPLLLKTSANTRNSAILFLSSFPEQMEKHIRSLLFADNKDLQLYGLDILRDLKHPDTGDLLADMLRRDLHVNVLISVLERAAESQCSHLIEPIKAITKRYPSEPLLEFTSTMTIKRLGEENAYH